MNIKYDRYADLPTDEKLVVMFEQLQNMNDKVDECLVLNKNIRIIENTLSDHDRRLKLLEYKSIDLEASSRRNNLIFSGIPEQMDENCTLTLENFIRDQLHVTDWYPIRRVHRLGRFKRSDTRSIIALFLDYRDTQTILSSASKLKGSHFSINKDFPKEIANARKKNFGSNTSVSGKQTRRARCILSILRDLLLTVEQWLTNSPIGALSCKETESNRFHIPSVTIISPKQNKVTHVIHVQLTVKRQDRTASLCKMKSMSGAALTTTLDADNPNLHIRKEEEHMLRFPNVRLSRAPLRHSTISNARGCPNQYSHPMKPLPKPTSYRNRKSRRKFHR